MSRPVATVLLCSMLLAACRIPENALDAPLAIPLRVDATANTVELDAPTWFAPETGVYLCSVEPAPLPEPGPGRVGWQPISACRSFGRERSTDGLRVVLDLNELTEVERGSFRSTATWYVLLVKLEGDRATVAFHSAFDHPEGFE